MKQLLSVIILSGILTCGKNSVDTPSADMDAVEGIYSLTSFTRNETSCTKGEESLAGQKYRYILLSAQDFSPYGPYLYAYLCESVEKCTILHQQLKSKTMALYDGEQIAVFNQGSASTGFHAQMATTGMTGNNECRGAYVSDVHLDFSGTSCSIEARFRYADTFPVDAGGYCTTDNTLKFLHECSEMKTCNADFLQSAE